MSTKTKKNIVCLCIVIGLLVVMIVVLKAKAAQIQGLNNQLIKENTATQGELDTMDLKIKAANSIDNIEKVASSRLGMVYPKDGECVYLSEEKNPKENLALKIQSNAFN